jgi:pimeloyl-ACP methyl ester carboxylesterase
LAYFIVLATVIALMLLTTWWFTRHTNKKIERQFLPTGTFTEVDGGRIHWHQQGQGPALILIHGLAGNGLNFSTLAAQLAEHYTVYNIDRPGSGFSERHAKTSANFKQQSQMILQWMDKVGLTTAFVVGHSMGGAISLRLALDAPNRIRAITLLCPLTTPAMEPPGPLMSLYIPHTGLRHLLANTLATPIQMQRGKKGVAQVFYPEAVPNTFALEGGGALSLHSKRFFHASSDIVASASSLYEQYERYDDIKCPVGVLFGENDKILRPNTHIPAVTSKVSNSISDVIPNAGHMIPITRPHECKAFIDKVFASAT